MTARMTLVCDSCGDTYSCDYDNVAQARENAARWEGWQRRLVGARAAVMQWRDLCEPCSRKEES